MREAIQVGLVVSETPHSFSSAHRVLMCGQAQEILRNIVGSFRRQGQKLADLI